MLSNQRLERINALRNEVALAYTPDLRPGPLVTVACLLAPVPERALKRLRRATNVAKHAESFTSTRAAGHRRIFMVTGSTM